MLRLVLASFSGFLLACGDKGTGSTPIESPDTAQPPADGDADTDTDTDADADTGRDTGTTHTDTGEPESEFWRSALYPSDWMPGFQIDMDDDAPPAMLHDFSYAGYRAGEHGLPEVDTDDAIEVTDHGADPTGTADSTAAIQAAIDAAATAGGGTVHLSAGTYRVDGLLTVTDSNIVIAGDGPGSTQISFTRDTDMTQQAHLSFGGSQSDGESILLETDANRGDTVIAMSTVGELAEGDPIGLGMVISEAFVTEHQMDGHWGFSAGERRTIFKRTVVAVDSSTTPPTLTIDVPLRYPLLTRDSADVRTERGAITECGLQDLAVSSAVDWTSAWAFDRSHVIAFERVKDCWMRNVTSWPGLVGDEEHHLQSGGVIVSRSRRVTVADSTLEKAQNRGPGGNGYLFEIRQSDEVLIRDSIARDGRHNFIQNWDFGTTGCVFLRTHSEGGQSWTDAEGSYIGTGKSEFHHALAMANLVDDSTADDGWSALNRLLWSSGAGHTATETVFWNTRGAGELTSLQYGRGYVIGTEGLTVRTEVTETFDSLGTTPEDWVEGLDNGNDLLPSSLYDDQLARRMGLER